MITFSSSGVKERERINQTNQKPFLPLLDETIKEDKKVQVKFFRVDWDLKADWRAFRREFEINETITRV